MEQSSEKPVPHGDSQQQAGRETSVPADFQPQQGGRGDLTRDAKMWAMFCHLGGLAGFLVPVILSGIIAPLIVWQVKREDDPFIDANGKEALNFQISIGIYAFVSALLIPVFCIGAFLLAAVSIFDLVFIIIAALKANNGQFYEYPLTIRFVK